VSSMRMFSLMFVTAVVTISCSSNGGTSATTPTAPSSDNSADASFNLDSELAYCVAETNRYRTSVGVAPLARSSALEAYAAIGAGEDGLAHVAHQHFRSTNGGGVASAENVIPWWRSTSVHQVIHDGLAMMWNEGPGGGHYENMRGRYTQLGCGIFVNGGEITVVQDFR
jgi:uncharacterized protein YkwD